MTGDWTNDTWSARRYPHPIVKFTPRSDGDEHPWLDHAGCRYSDGQVGRTAEVEAQYQRSRKTYRGD